MKHCYNNYPLTISSLFTVLLVKTFKRKQISINYHLFKTRFDGWLFWAKRPFETVFQSISGRLPERGREKRDDRRE